MTEKPPTENPDGVCPECGKVRRPTYNPDDPSEYIGDEHGNWILVHGKYLSHDEVEALTTERDQLKEQLRQEEDKGLRALTYINREKEAVEAEVKTLKEQVSGFKKLVETYQEDIEKAGDEVKKEVKA